MESVVIVVIVHKGNLFLSLERENLVLPGRTVSCKVFKWSGAFCSPEYIYVIAKQIFAKRFYRQIE